MYAVELRFSVDQPAIMPSTDVLAVSFRRNCERCAGRVEHISMYYGERETQMVAFVMASSAARARRFAQCVGAAMVAEYPHIRFTRPHVWRDDRT
jgi:hypothetical protein